MRVLSPCNSELAGRSGNRGMSCAESGRGGCGDHECPYHRRQWRCHPVRHNHCSGWQNRLASAGTANIENLKIIDANGMSAMPGFIDAHKHINTGPNEKELMQSLLEAGYTTVLLGGGPGDGNLTLRDHMSRE
jgi:hypothetical protein